MAELPHSRYFEGVLQLRYGTPEVITYILSAVKKSRKAAIVDTQKVKNGFDYYFSSQRYLQQMGKQLKERFHGELVVSSKIFTRDRASSKEVHRVYVLFRVNPIKKWDVIDYRGDKLRVLSAGKNLHCKNLANGKRVLLKYEDVRMHQ